MKVGRSKAPMTLGRSGLAGITVEPTALNRSVVGAIYRPRSLGLINVEIINVAIT